MRTSINQIHDCRQTGQHTTRGAGRQRSGQAHIHLPTCHKRQSDRQAGKPKHKNRVVWHVSGPPSPKWYTCSWFLPRVQFLVWQVGGRMGGGAIPHQVTRSCAGPQPAYYHCWVWPHTYIHIVRQHVSESAPLTDRQAGRQTYIHIYIQTVRQRQTGSHIQTAIYIHIHTYKCIYIHTD